MPNCGEALGRTRGEPVVEGDEGMATCKSEWRGVRPLLRPYEEMLGWFVLSTDAGRAMSGSVQEGEVSGSRVGRWESVLLTEIVCVEVGGGARVLAFACACGGG